MTREREFYIDGAWTGPVEPRLQEVIDPSSEEPFTQVAMGSAADVELAVAAAADPMATWVNGSSDEGSITSCRRGSTGPVQAPSM